MRCKALLLSLAFVGVQSLATADEKEIAKGKELCEQKKCAICHKEGSKTGKPMNQLVQGRTDEYLKGSLVEPKKTI
ncbi:MAG: hypothetical protein FJ279_15770, partial [Planctomycetes bacterium]|nr:hypothetical protein [Planctomycetota bacterium]